MFIQFDRPITLQCQVLLVMQAVSIAMEIKVLMEINPINPLLSQLEKVVSPGWLSLRTQKFGCDFPGAVIQCYFAEFHQRQS